MMNIETLAAAEHGCQAMAAAAGRPYRQDTSDLCALFTLMNKCSVFFSEKKKIPNQYTVKPKRLDLINLEKIDNLFIPEFMHTYAVYMCCSLFYLCFDLLFMAHDNHHFRSFFIGSASPVPPLRDIISISTAHQPSCISLIFLKLRIFPIG